MIRARFYESKGLIREFRISGHAGYAEKGRDVVCASVSSAVQLAANILTDGFCMEAEAEERNNEIFCSVDAPDERSEAVLRMLVAQLGMILEEFPNTIKITFSEV